MVFSQDVFTEASRFMFAATGNRMYFKKIKVVVPKTWSRKKYSNMSVPSLSKQYIIVDDNIRGIITPHVWTTKPMCGSEGKYMFLSSTEFILEDGDTKWGSHGRSQLRIMFLTKLYLYKI